MTSTHSGRLERWLGQEKVAQLSRDMRGWYGPPIAISGVPGNVVVGGDGDFIGEIRAGWEMSALDRAWDLARRLRRGARHATGPQARNQLNAGFSSLSDMISEATAGAKLRNFTFNKVGPTGVVGATSSLWRLGPQPAVGATPAAAAAGTAFDKTSTGGFPFTNPTGGDTQHFVAGYGIASIAQSTLLLYDLLFGVAKTMASTATEAVTGVPTRYTSTTGGAADSAEGNFLFIQVAGTALAATAHNWTVCKYTNQAGTTGQSAPSMTGNSSAIVDRLDHPIDQWFMPLASGDTGLTALTQMQCSASVATGVIWFMIGHPIAWMPCPIARLVCAVDGINTSFNLARVFDSACLAFLDVTKPVTTATTYHGTFTTLAG